MKISKLFFLIASIIVLLKTPVLAEATRTYEISIRPDSSGLTNSEGNVIVRDAFQEVNGIAFSNDGRKVFSSNRKVTGTHECVSMMELSTPYDLRTASLVLDEASPMVTQVGLDDNDPDSRCTDIKFSKDGLKMFLGNQTGKIHGFDLASPFDLSNITYSNNVTGDLGDEPSFSFSNDGKKLFYLEGKKESQKILEYSLSTAYDLTDITLVNTLTLTTTANVSDSNDYGRAVEFSQDGMTMFVLINDRTNNNNTSLDSVFQFSLTTAFSTSTATSVGSLTVPEELSLRTWGMALSPTGNKLYLVSLVGSTNASRYVGSGSVDVVTQIGLSCDYGIVACVSDPKSSLSSQVQLAKNNIHINTSIIFKRFEWIERNRNTNTLNNFNASIKSDNPFIIYWANKLEDKVVARLASLKKNSTKNEKNNWSYWSHGDLSIGTYHEKSGGAGITLEKPKDIRTDGITFGVDKKNGENDYSGFALRYADGKSKFPNSAHGTTMDSLTLNYYKKSPFKENGYTNMIVGLSSLKFDLKTDGTLTGKRNGKQLFTSFNLRNNDEFGKFNLTPSLKFNYSLTHLSDYTEFLTNISSKATNVIYEDETFLTGDLAAGILFNSDPIKIPEGIFRHNGGLEFVYDYSPDIDFEYSYAGSSNTQIYEVEKYSQKNIRANYGYEALYNNKFTLSLNYERLQHLDSNKFSHTDSLFVKVGRVKEDDYEFAFNIDALQDYKINNYYLINLGGFDLKISSNYNFMSEIPDHGASLEISSKF